jgi:hypothetical protein
LKTDHRFAAAPVPSSVDSITSGNKRILAVTSDAADAPYRAAMDAGGRGPCRYYAGWIWIIYRHAHQPTMPVVAILHAPIPDVKNVIYYGECRSLLLNLRGEG